MLIGPGLIIWAVSNILSDTLILILPLPSLWKLLQAFERRIKIMGLFVFGGMFVTPHTPYLNSTKMLSGSALQHLSSCQYLYSRNSRSQSRHEVCETALGKPLVLGSPDCTDESKIWWNTLGSQGGIRKAEVGN